MKVLSLLFLLFSSISLSANSLLFAHKNYNPRQIGSDWTVFVDFIILGIVVCCWYLYVKNFDNPEKKYYRFFVIVPISLMVFIFYWRDLIIEVLKLMKEFFYPL